MNSEYIFGRIRVIISSFVGIYPEDVEKDMSLSDFNIGKYEVAEILDLISDEFDIECEYSDITPDSTVEDIINNIR